MSNEVLMIGNVQFNKSEVKSSTTHIDASGKKINTVFMKDGTKIEFHDQQITDPNKLPSVMMGRDASINNPPMGIKFSNFESGKVTGTPNKDYYYMSNSKMVVDVSLDGNEDDVVKIAGPKGPTVLKDAGDTEIDIRPDSFINGNYINMNEGLWFKA